MNNLSKRKITSCVLKAIVFISAFFGVLLSALAGRVIPQGVRKVFMYFTIQSNILIALICIIGLYLFIKNKTISTAWQIIKFTGTVSITLTGIVFCFVLAPTQGSAAWNIQNILTHVIVPLVSVIDFFVAAPYIKLKFKNIIYVIIPPLIYAIYASIAYVNGWQFARGYNYPYFFLNWGSPCKAFGFSKELPFMGTAWWILALLLFIIFTGFIYLVIARALSKKTEN